eukprot:scpid49678/ scgid0214/ 
MPEMEEALTKNKPFCLPNPDTRVVVFCKTVFKLKLRSSMPRDARLLDFFGSDGVQYDIQRVVNATLRRACRGLPLQPFCAGQLVFYPYVRYWPAPKDLLFLCDGQPLKACSFVIILSVEAHRAKCLQSQPVAINKGSTAIGGNSTLPSHQRTSTRSLAGSSPPTPTSDEDSCHSSCSECASSSSNGNGKMSGKRKRKRRHSLPRAKRLFDSARPAPLGPNTRGQQNMQSLSGEEMATGPQINASKELSKQTTDMNTELSTTDCQDQQLHLGKRFCRWLLGIRT